MATRAYIGILTEEKEVQYIYLHFDGDSAFSTLIRHYNTKEKAQALIDMGDCSSLGKTLKESVFYHRDRKEPIGKHKEWSERLFFRQREVPYTYLFNPIEGAWTRQMRNI